MDFLYFAAGMVNFLVFRFQKTKTKTFFLSFPVSVVTDKLGYHKLKSCTKFFGAKNIQ
jgi:3-phenylpropionate/cinnamic acid dioxygenase small subunit